MSNLTRNEVRRKLRSKSTAKNGRTRGERTHGKRRLHWQPCVKGGARDCGACQPCTARRAAARTCRRYSLARNTSTRASNPES